MPIRGQLRLYRLRPCHRPLQRREPFLPRRGDRALVGRASGARLASQMSLLFEATGEFFLLCSRGCWRLISDKLLLGRDKAFNASIAHKHDLPEDLEDSRVHIIAAARTHFTDADQARRSDPFAILGLTLGAT